MAGRWSTPTVHDMLVDAGSNYARTFQSLQGPRKCACQHESVHSTVFVALRQNTNSDRQVSRPHRHERLTKRTQIHQRPVAVRHHVRHISQGRSASHASPTGSVCLDMYAQEVHGIGWDSLAAILSTPQLRTFTVETFLFSPREAPSETWVDTLAPITTFRYVQPSFRSCLRTYPAQQDTLAFVLTHLHRSLESLLLPSEITPVAVLSQTQWPQLRELSLSGEFHLSAGYVAPFVSLFSRMSRLRVLNLALALPPGVDRKQLMLWPEGYESRLPWPDLEALTVSFPDPEDGIFSRLPLSLRRLSLRYTPHHCLHLWERNQYSYYRSPILRASEMLEVLTKLSAPLLGSL